MRKMTASIILIFAVVLLSSCTKSYHPVSETSFHFDTVISITLYNDDAELIPECMQLCEEADRLYSMYNPSSLLYRLNNEGPGEDTSDLVPIAEAAFSWCELTKGAVDPAIGAVSSLWAFHNEDNRVCPDDAAVSEALSHIDPASFVLSRDPGRIEKTDPYAMMDLGFITKGYVSAQIKDYLTERGINSGIINLGGNVVVIGTKPDGSSYTVGIQRPFDAGAMLTIDITDAAVVTSGIYERCFEHDGKLYHHILDPETGYPVENDLYSVTIVSDDPVAADALSTACFVMGKDEALKYIEGIGNAEALIIDKDYNIFTSSGFPEYTLTE